MTEKWTNKYDAIIAQNNQERMHDEKGDSIPSIDKSLDFKTFGQGVYFEHLSPKAIEVLSEQDKVAYIKYFKQKEQQIAVMGEELGKLRKLRENRQGSADEVASSPSSGSSHSGKSLDPLEILKIIDEMEADIADEWFGVDSKKSHEEPFAVSYQNFVGMPLNLKLHDFSYYKDRLQEVLIVKNGTKEDVVKGNILMERLEDALQAKAEAENYVGIAAAEPEEAQDTIYSGPEEVDYEGDTVISGEPNFVDAELPVLENSFEPTQYPLVESTQHPEADSEAIGHYDEVILKAQESSKLTEAPFLVKIKAKFPRKKVSEALETDLSARLAVEIALKLTEGNIKKLNLVAPSSKMKVSVEEDFARLTERQKTLNESVLENRGVSKYIEDSELLGLEIQILDSLKSEFSNEQMHAVSGLCKQKERELEEMTASVDADDADQETLSRTAKLDKIKTARRELPHGAFSDSTWGVRRRRE